LSSVRTVLVAAAIAISVAASMVVAVVAVVVVPSLVAIPAVGHDPRSGVNYLSAYVMCFCLRKCQKKKT